ncbi:hypothetical protein OROMI_005264 [Orobanche minor]
MAKSKYEYVKTFEVEDEIMPPNIIVVRIDGRDFRRFSELHEFEKPYDRKSLELMNACAMSVLEQFEDISFSYGFSDEYSFVFKKGTEFYKRRARQNTLSHRIFLHFCLCRQMERVLPSEELEMCPIISITSYLLCIYGGHLNNQYDTCFWQLMKSGKTEKEAEEMLKGSQKQVKNELLYQSFNINYKKDIPEIFRQGTCVYRTEKCLDNGCHVKRPRKVKRPRNIITVHSKNIASRRFWNEQSCLLEELGQFNEDLNKTKADYVRSFQYESRLMPFTWIVIRVDGCHFQRFSKDHEFEKPNDAQALNLMNSCAACVLEEFMDIVFAYGDSDEYSFVLKKESQLYGRHARERKGESRKYIDIRKDMYEGASTSVRANVGRTEEFPITIGVHQGSALSPFLFAIVMDELTRGIQNDVPWCMMFADDIVLIDDTKVGVQQKLELWRDTLEARGFRLSRIRFVILFCGIRGGEGEGGRVSSSPLSPSTTSTSTRLSISMRLSKGHDSTLTMGSPENKSSFSSQEGFSGRTGSSFSVIHSSSESISSTTMGSILFLLLMLLSLSLKLYFT